MDSSPLAFGSGELKCKMLNTESALKIQNGVSSIKYIHVLELLIRRPLSVLNVKFLCLQLSLSRQMLS